MGGDQNKLTKIRPIEVLFTGSDGWGGKKEFRTSLGPRFPGKKANDR